MMNFISHFIMSSMAFAGEGTDHPHGAGGETEHLWPVLGVFVVLIVAGVAFNIFSKKKK